MPRGPRPEDGWPAAIANAMRLARVKSGLIEAEFAEKLSEALERDGARLRLQVAAGLREARTSLGLDLESFAGELSAELGQTTTAAELEAWEFDGDAPSSVYLAARHLAGLSFDPPEAWLSAGITRARLAPRAGSFPGADARQTELAVPHPLGVALFLLLVSFGVVAAVSGFVWIGRHRLRSRSARFIWAGLRAWLLISVAIALVFLATMTVLSLRG